jgi:hypothetical protein
VNNSGQVELFVSDGIVGRALTSGFTCIDGY